MYISFDLTEEKFINYRVIPGKSIKLNKKLILAVFAILYVLTLGSRTKYDFLEIPFNDRNQVYHKIAWGLGGGFLSIHSSFVKEIVLPPWLD